MAGLSEVTNGLQEEKGKLTAEQDRLYAKREWITNVDRILVQKVPVKDNYA